MAHSLVSREAQQRRCWEALGALAGSRGRLLPPSRRAWSGPPLWLCSAVGATTTLAAFPGPAGVKCALYLGAGHGASALPLGRAGSRHTRGFREDWAGGGRGRSFLPELHPGVKSEFTCRGLWGARVSTGISVPQGGHMN